MFVITHMGKPVRVTESYALSVEFMERQSGSAFSKYEVSGTGKLMRLTTDERKVFTGWETHKVEAVA